MDQVRVVGNLLIFQPKETVGGWWPAVKELLSMIR